MSALIVSFLGNNDLELAGLPRRPEEARTPAPGERSPLLRVVDDLVSRNLFGNDGSILILDDRAQKGDDRGQQYCAHLGGYVAALLSVPAIPVTAHPFDISDPTDLDRLYKEVVEVMRSIANERTDVLINLTSGTPAMHTTLVLAASYLPLKPPKFFVSSPAGQVNEVRLPYMVFVRRRIEVDRAPNRGSRQALRAVSPLAGIKLPPFTARSDAVVATVLGAVAKARRTPQPVLIAGATGSGKTWAALAAAFNSGLKTIVIDAQFADALPTELAPDDDRVIINVIVKHLEAASESLLRAIGIALDTHLNLRWTTTWRTDQYPRNPGSPCFTEIRRRLAAGGEFLMPPPAERIDVVELSEYMFEEAGQWPTKVKERFQYELATANLPDGLHALRRWVGCAAALSPTRHTDQAAFKAAGRQVEAIAATAVLQHASAALAGGGWGFPVLRLLQVVEHATQLIAEASNQTQDELTKQLGYSNRTTYAKRKNDSAAAYREFANRFAVAGEAPVEAKA